MEIYDSVCDSLKAKLLKRKCHLPQKDNPDVSSMLWIMAMDDCRHVTVLEKKMGCPLTSATFNCGCSRKVMPIEDVAVYLKQMFTDKMFTKAIVLTGKEEAVHHLRNALPEAIRSIVITEIVQPEHLESKGISTTAN